MAGDYLVFEPAKRAIDKDEINDTDKEWLLDNIPKANRQIENDTADLIDAYPTDDTTDLYKSYSDAATAWLRYQWSIFQSDEQGKTDALEEYQTTLKGIRTLLASKPDENTRSKKASYSTSYSSTLLKNIPGVTDGYGNLLT